MLSETPTRFEYLANTADAALQVALCGTHPTFVSDHVIAVAQDATQQRDALTFEEAEQDYWRHLEMQLLK